MRSVNVHAAKTHFSRLLSDVAAGDEIVIAKAGTPIAKLVAIHEPARRPAGPLKGQFSVPHDFDTMFDEDMRAMFEHGTSSPNLPRAPSEDSHRHPCPALVDHFARTPHGRGP